jgi:holo-[acyl-carrier protein] synthase
MTLKTGIDITSVDRFRDLEYSQNLEFYAKIFDKVEIEYCLSFKDPYPVFGGKFAIKEAIQKILEKPMNFLEIHTRHYANKAPKIEGELTKTYQIEVSISHEKNYAIGIVIAEKIIK